MVYNQMGRSTSVLVGRKLVCEVKSTEGEHVCEIKQVDGVGEVITQGT